MNLYTRRRALRLLVASGSGAFAASHLGLLADQGRAANLQISQAGALDFSLVAEAGHLSLAGRRATLYSYNGSVPGPRLEIRPGDQVRIRFANRLAEPTNGPSPSGDLLKWRANSETCCT